MKGLVSQNWICQFHFHQIPCTNLGNEGQLVTPNFDPRRYELINEIFDSSDLK